MLKSSNREINLDMKKPQFTKLATRKNHCFLKFLTPLKTPPHPLRQPPP